MNSFRPFQPKPGLKPTVRKIALLNDDPSPFPFEREDELTFKGDDRAAGELLLLLMESLRQFRAQNGANITIAGNTTTIQQNICNILNSYRAAVSGGISTELRALLTNIQTSFSAGTVTTGQAEKMMEQVASQLEKIRISTERRSASVSHITEALRSNSTTDIRKYAEQLKKNSELTRQEFLTGLDGNSARKGAGLRPSPEFGGDGVRVLEFAYHTLEERVPETLRELLRREKSGRFADSTDAHFNAPERHSTGSPREGRSALNDRVERLERTYRTERTERTERSERTERLERNERIAHNELTQRTQRTEFTQLTQLTQRPTHQAEFAEHTDRDERFQRSVSEEKTLITAEPGGQSKKAVTSGRIPDGSENTAAGAQTRKPRIFVAGVNLPAGGEETVNSGTAERSDLLHAPGTGALDFASATLRRELLERFTEMNSAERTEVWGMHSGTASAGMVSMRAAVPAGGIFSRISRGIISATAGNAASRAPEQAQRFRLETSGLVFRQQIPESPEHISLREKLLNVRDRISSREVTELERLAVHIPGEVRGERTADVAPTGVGAEHSRGGKASPGSASGASQTGGAFFTWSRGNIHVHDGAAYNPHEQSAGGASVRQGDPVPGGAGGYAHQSSRTEPAAINSAELKSALLRGNTLISEKTSFLSGGIFWNVYYNSARNHFAAEWSRSVTVFREDIRRDHSENGAQGDNTRIGGAPEPRSAERGIITRREALEPFQPVEMLRMRSGAPALGGIDRVELRGGELTYTDGEKNVPADIPESEKAAVSRRQSVSAERPAAYIKGLREVRERIFSSKAVNSTERREKSFLLGYGARFSVSDKPGIAPTVHGRKRRQRRLEKSLPAVVKLEYSGGALYFRSAEAKSPGSVPEISANRAGNPRAAVADSPADNTATRKPHAAGVVPVSYGASAEGAAVRSSLNREPGRMDAAALARRELLEHVLNYGWRLNGSDINGRNGAPGNSGAFGVAGENGAPGAAGITGAAGENGASAGLRTSAEYTREQAIMLFREGASDIVGSGALPGGSIPEGKPPRYGSGSSALEFVNRVMAGSPAAVRRAAVRSAAVTGQDGAAHRSPGSGVPAVYYHALYDSREMLSEAAVNRTAGGYQYIGNSYSESVNVYALGGAEAEDDGGLVFAALPERRGAVQAQEPEEKAEETSAVELPEHPTASPAAVPAPDERKLTELIRSTVEKMTTAQEFTEQVRRTVLSAESTERLCGLVMERLEDRLRTESRISGR